MARVESRTLVALLLLLARPALGEESSTAQPERRKSSSNADAGLVGDAWGEPAGGVAMGPLSFRILSQVRYSASFAPKSRNPRVSYRAAEDSLAQHGDGWELKRLFLRLGADPYPAVGFKAIFDFAELVRDKADNTVKQAYVTLRPIPKHLEFTAGIFKLPFSILELDPISQWELADLGQADSLVKDLGFAGKDLGAEVMLAPLPKSKLLRLAVGAFRGHSKDEHDAVFGAVGARLEARPLKGVRLGIDWVEHPESHAYDRVLNTSKKNVLPDPEDPRYPRRQTWTGGRAWSADLTLDYRHLMLRAEAMIGDRVDHDTRFGAHSFRAFWALGAYRFRAGPIHLMPAVRAEWLDADHEHNTGLRRQLSCALNVLLPKKTRFVFDLTRTEVDRNSPLLDQPKPLQDPPYLELPRTVITWQLQVEI